MSPAIAPKRQAGPRVRVVEVVRVEESFIVNECRMKNEVDFNGKNQ